MAPTGTVPLLPLMHTGGHTHTLLLSLPSSTPLPEPLPLLTSLSTLYPPRGDGTNKDRATAAVDAHWGATTTLYYYKDVHGRNGVDGRGSPMHSRVHLSKDYDNAYCE